MRRDPLDDIMGYLGFGLKPGQGSLGDASKAAVTTVSADSSGGNLLASVQGCTLWLMSNENAAWIELRGPFTTLRATRPKARLLIDAEESLRNWASGGSPKKRSQNLSIIPTRKQGVPILEIKFKSWKPLRLSREQADALIAMLGSIRKFAL